jgi:hypothetical protein
MSLPFFLPRTSPLADGLVFCFFPAPRRNPPAECPGLFLARPRGIVLRADLIIKENEKGAGFWRAGHRRDILTKRAKEIDSDSYFLYLPKNKCLNT